MFENTPCKGKSHLFFPETRERAADRTRRETAAAAICASCPVCQECRDFARTNNEIGFWGGESDEDRKRNMVMT